MKRNKILSSAFVMTMVSFGAFAADSTITGGAGTCTVEVLGVHDNNATANTIATWTLNKYTLVPGKRLNVTDTDVETVDCDSGSYCPGGEYTVETASEATKSCPADFPNSETGAGADTQCYTACTVDMVAKATSVTGNDYYGSGVDTCEPTACVAGWHVKPGLNLMETIGDVDGTDSAYIDNNGVFVETGSYGQEYYGISNNMTFAIYFGYHGMVTGRATCSTKKGNRYISGDKITGTTIYNTVTDETGQEGAKYCYCQLNEYTDTNGVKIKFLSAPWVFYDDMRDDVGCHHQCPRYCSIYLNNYASTYAWLREAMFKSIVIPATCAANTINIDWNPDNGGEHIKNMCTYEGAIELPTPDPVKPGYTFTGWKLVE